MITIPKLRILVYGYLDAIPSAPRAPVMDLPLLPVAVMDARNSRPAPRLGLGARFPSFQPSAAATGRHGVSTSAPW